MRYAGLDLWATSDLGLPCNAAGGPTQPTPTQPNPTQPNSRQSNPTEPTHNILTLRLNPSRPSLLQWLDAGILKLRLSQTRCHSTTTRPEQERRPRGGICRWNLAAIINIHDSGSNRQQMVFCMLSHGHADPVVLVHRSLLNHSVTSLLHKSALYATR